MTAGHVPEVRTNVLVDQGPVRDAALILVSRSTLADHVIVFDDYAPTEIEIDPNGVPFAMWGSGTQALWRLLCAIAYSRQEVSLYEVVSRLDQRNTAAAGAALAALCGVSA